MKNRILAVGLIIILCSLSNYSLKAQMNGKINELTFSKEGRSEILFDEGWRFSLGDPDGAEQPVFNDSGWRNIDLPQDSSIEDIAGTNSPFDKNAKNGVALGFTVGGTDWYRKTFDMPAVSSKKMINVYFEGVYINSTVWVIGNLIGNHSNGYTSFGYDISRFIVPGAKNVIAVKVVNKGSNRRWYSGSGNYRHVWLSISTTEWYSSGLDRLKFYLDDFRWEKQNDDTVLIEVKNVLVLGNQKGAFLNHFRYTIDGSGEMRIEHTIIPNVDMPSWLPRIGTAWILDKSLENVQWYGRGPEENYPDRKSGYKTGIYKSTVNEMYVPYLIPQDYGLRTENRWVKMTDASGTGLEFKGNSLFNFSAQPYSTENLTKALYTYQLHPFEGIIFNFDYATSGLGDTPRSVFTQYQVMPQRYDFIMSVRPVKE